MNEWSVKASATLNSLSKSVSWGIQPVFVTNLHGELEATNFRDSLEKQSQASGRSSTISVPTPIARWVSLSLDNTTANPVSSGLAHNGFPDEKSGQLSRITWQAGP
jgi:hypothetical protein